MRKIPPNSTDVLYSAFPLEDMTEIGKALGVDNINFVTKACLQPGRALYHACVNNVCALLHAGDSLDEIERGTLIADRADRIYNHVNALFDAKLEESAPQIREKYSLVNAFMERLKPAQDKPWDKQAFLQHWQPDRLQYRWQRKAVETYALTRDNIEKGVYVPSPGWDAIRATHYWSDRNLEYKHHRDLARTLVTVAIDELYPHDKLQPTLNAERKMTIVSGGMGSGKSSFTRDLWMFKTDDEKRRILVHDADFVKIAFGRSAVLQETIDSFAGPEVHNESSIALYENCRKRHYLARRKHAAPNVIINSIGAGSFELAEGLEGGGHVQVWCLSISEESALRITRERATRMGRLPDEDTVRWSTRYCVQNLTTLADHAGSNLQAFIYDRTENEQPVVTATWNVKDNTLFVHNIKRFFEVASRAELAPKKDAAIRAFISALLEKGVTICFQPGKEAPLVKLTPDRSLTTDAKEMPSFLKEILHPLCKTISCGSATTQRKTTLNR